MSIFIFILGKTLALCPEFILRGLCIFVMLLMKIFMPKRMRIIYSNLKKCYPDYSDKKIRSFAFESGARTIEMGIFVLASPYMKPSKLQERFKLSDSLKQYLAHYEANPKSIVLLVPHFCMMEAITMLPILHEGKTPRTGVFYRPMDSKPIDNWVLKTRSRFGINLISRKAGLGKAFDFLKDNGTVAVLFDQSAGATGFLGYFFDMPCYTSNLAGLFAEKYKSDVGFMYARRTGFFRAEIHAEMIDCPKDNISVMLAANAKLEELLKSDESLSADWLWLHNRWKLSHKHEKLLNLRHSKNVCEETKPASSAKKQSICLNLPNTKEDIDACLPLIGELGVSREDASIILLCEVELKDYVLSLNTNCEVVAFPPAKLSFFEARKEIKSLQDRYISLLIQFGQDSHSDFIKRKIKALRNIAMPVAKNLRKGYECARNIDSNAPRAKQYRAFLEYFGLPKSK